jgi:methylthioribulose-1-phosphate dehydratase
VGALEKVRRSNCRSGVAPVGGKGSNHRQARKTEVGHGARRCANVQRVPRRDEDNIKSIVIGFWKQAIILVGLPPAHAACPTLPLIHCTQMSSDQTANSSAEIEALCAAARWCAARGWVPATSGNFSVRPFPDTPGRVLITPSGLDKGALTPSDLLEVDQTGRAVAGSARPSAETGLHAVIYRHHRDARAIMHVHTVWNTLLSERFERVGSVAIEGYELLKGLSGVSTHMHREEVPIIENTQDYNVLCTELAQVLQRFPRAHGVLLSRHGLYTWGQSVAEARRHLEALEFLFEAEGRRLFAGSQ